MGQTKINWDLYTIEEKEILREYVKDKNVKWKKCKKCGKLFPIDRVFFLPEKRIKDGFENSCRICRSKGKIISFKNYIQADKTRLSKFSKKLKNKYIKNNQDIVKFYNEYLQTGIIPYKGFMKDNYKIIVKYLIEEKLKMKEQDIYKITRNWLKDYKLYSVSLDCFNGSTFKLLDEVYPNKFLPWYFSTVGLIYWKDINNIRNALEWFVKQLYKDNIIKSIEDIPYLITGDVFSQYNLKGLLVSHFKQSPFLAFNFLYPNKFFEWEYKTTPDGYWHKKENRIKAMKQLIENRLCLDIADDSIMKVISYQYFSYSKKYHKFKTIIETYYNLNVWDWIKECYPMTYKNFYKNIPCRNKYVTLDDIIVKSEHERKVHHILMNDFKECYYAENVNCIFHDDAKNVNYIPDWIIKHDNKIIIVEYYGYIRDKYYNNFNSEIGYINKYRNKHDFYTKLCNDDAQYTYIELFPSDVISNTKLINKFNICGLELNISDDIKRLYE